MVAFAWRVRCVRPGSSLSAPTKNRRPPLAPNAACEVGVVQPNRRRRRITPPMEATIEKMMITLALISFLASTLRLPYRLSKSPHFTMCGLNRWRYFCAAKLTASWVELGSFSPHQTRMALSMINRQLTPAKNDRKSIVFGQWKWCIAWVNRIFFSSSDKDGYGPSDGQSRTLLLTWKVIEAIVTIFENRTRFTLTHLYAVICRYWGLSGWLVPAQGLDVTELNFFCSEKCSQKYANAPMCTQTSPSLQI